MRYFMVLITIRDLYKLSRIGKSKVLPEISIFERFVYHLNHFR